LVKKWLLYLIIGLLKEEYSVLSVDILNKSSPFGKLI